MADIEKAIKEVESNLGRELTVKETQMAKMLGGLMNALWNESDNGGDTQSALKEDS